MLHYEDVREWWVALPRRIEAGWPKRERKAIQRWLDAQEGDVLRLTPKRLARLPKEAQRWVRYQTWWPDGSLRGGSLPARLDGESHLTEAEQLRRLAEAIEAGKRLPLDRVGGRHLNEAEVAWNRYIGAVERTQALAERAVWLVDTPEGRLMAAVEALEGAEDSAFDVSVGTTRLRKGVSDFGDVLLTVERARRTEHWSIGPSSDGSVVWGIQVVSGGHAIASAAQLRALTRLLVQARAERDANGAPPVVED